MPISVGNVVEVAVQGDIFNQMTLTILHYVVGQTPTQQDPLVSQADIIDLIKTGGTFDICTKYRACAATSWTLKRLSAQYIWPTRIRKTFFPINAAGTGSSSTQVSNTTAMIEKLSFLAGRKNRGAIHFPAPPDNEKSGGSFAFGYIGDLRTLATQLETPLVEAGGGAGRWDPFILHRTHPLNGTGVVWEDSEILDTIRVQRRRTVGVGK